LFAFYSAIAIAKLLAKIGFVGRNKSFQNVKLLISFSFFLIFNMKLLFISLHIITKNSPIKGFIEIKFFFFAFKQKKRLSHEHHETALLFGLI